MARANRAVRVALSGLSGTIAQTAPGAVRISAEDAYMLGRAVARLEVALWGERLTSSMPTGPATSHPPEAVMTIAEARGACARR
jgi:coenzyme F420-0:L-glutamate ligase/coenzyme F420-1:gamma-L-glutamate ligase